MSIPSRARDRTPLGGEPLSDKTGGEMQNKQNSYTLNDASCLRVADRGDHDWDGSGLLTED